MLTCITGFCRLWLLYKNCFLYALSLFIWHKLFSNIYMYYWAPNLLLFAIITNILTPWSLDIGRKLNAHILNSYVSSIFSLRPEGYGCSSRSQLWKILEITLEQQMEFWPHIKQNTFRYSKPLSCKKVPNIM